VSACQPGGRRDSRISTRYRGISYRERDDGSRVFYVYADGRHHRVEGNEKEALLVQAHLRGKKARGLRVTPDKTTFGQLAKEWFEIGKTRWATSTQNGYRVALNTHLLPRFGAISLAQITPDEVARFVAERKGEGASGSYIAGNLRPLNGVFKLAVRRGLISSNPVAALLPEERPKATRRKRHVWTCDEITRLLAAARELGSRPGNVYDYTTLLVVAVFTGRACEVPI
jgi:integrase